MLRLCCGDLLIDHWCRKLSLLPGEGNDSHLLLPAAGTAPAPGTLGMLKGSSDAEGPQGC